MNIFGDESAFVGNYDAELFGGSFLSLLESGVEIRKALGKKGYWLETYLKLFFRAISNIRGCRYPNDGVETGYKLMVFCENFFNSQNTQSEHPLYPKARKVLEWQENNGFIFQEYITRKSLLYASLIDEFLSQSALPYEAEKRKDLSGACDVPEMWQLHEFISEKIGEAYMENLNLQLKNRFWPVPIMPEFVQGVMRVLGENLVLRDQETNKQVFQIMMDMVEKGFK